MTPTRRPGAGEKRGEVGGRIGLAGAAAEGVDGDDFRQESPYFGRATRSQHSNVVKLKGRADVRA